MEGQAFGKGLSDIENVTFVMLRKLQCGDVDLEAKELFVMHVE
jgi:hypothetical protein